MSADRPPRRVRPWTMLVVAVIAQASGTFVIATPAFLIPLLHTERGLPLVQAGLLATAPNLGLVLTLVGWGWLTDRIGERIVLAAGMLLTCAATIAAVFAEGYVALGAALVVAGAGAASSSAASGRVVIGWFPRERRGLAMGIRQSCQPLGVAAAAIAVPPLVAGGSIPPALVLGAVLVGISAVLCWVVVVDPPRPSRVREDGTVERSPYLTGSVLWRLHLVSALLVVPQFTLAVFGLVWLISDQGWTPLAAGILVAGSQLAGAGGRVAVGLLSDRVGSRLRPLRWVAIAGIALLLATAASGAVGWAWAVALSYLLATCVSVADNGLAFTAVAEFAGPHWSGRALGGQNTAQYLMAAVVGPVVGGLITLVGYPLAFAVVAIAPAVAAPLIPSSALEVERV